MTMREHVIHTLIENQVESDKPLVLSEETEQILKEHLKVEDLREVVDMPFPSSQKVETPISKPL